ncbi:MAG: ihfA [Gammaproteobacteria bacterium]|jgi:integration host factor subunit alpha|nr:ihfA [Gammaproteobacteria bacterium]
MAVTKADLVDNLFDTMGINKREAKEIVELLFEEMIMALERGQDVKLSGFGVFVLRKKNARPGRNPKTGLEVTIPPKRVVTFRVGEKLKVKVDNYAGSKNEADKSD